MPEPMSRIGALMDRLSTWRKLIFRPISGLALAAFGLAGAYDLVRSQFFPEEWERQTPRLYDLAIGLPWWAVPLMILIVLPFFVLEVAYREIKFHKNHAIDVERELDALSVTQAQRRPFYEAVRVTCSEGRLYVDLKFNAGKTINVRSIELEIGVGQAKLASNWESKLVHDGDIESVFFDLPEHIGFVEEIRFIVDTRGDGKFPTDWFRFDFTSGVLSVD